MPKIGLCLGVVFVGTFVGCAGQEVPAAQPLNAAPEPAPQATSAAPAPEAAPSGRDPAIWAVAKAALGCKFEEGSFDGDCKELEAWNSNEPLFEEGKGNDTLFSMLGDADEKVRLLAASKNLSEEYFANKERAAKLFEMLKKEPNVTVARDLAGHVTWVDAEAFSLGAELRALAKHPMADVREALGSTIAHHQTPAAIDAVTTLLADSQVSVARSAARYLSNYGATPPVEAVCKLLGQVLARTDPVGAVAIRSAVVSKCPGMRERGLAELAKRVADPSKLPDGVGNDYALGASDTCRPDASAALKKKAFEIGKKLSDEKVVDWSTRFWAIDALVSCDPNGAKAVLQRMTKDKSKPVAERAAKARAKLDEKKK